MGESIKSIESLDEYISIVMNTFSNIKPNSFYEKERFFFRGQNNTEYQLMPSLGRKVSKKSDVTYSIFENEMINTSKLQNPDEFTRDKYPVNMLARMQHYGLPTRLLDITENALVALYFACYGLYKISGKVYCFVRTQNDIHTAYSLHANLMASLYNFSMITNTLVADYWHKIKHEEFVHENERNKAFESIEENIQDTLRRPLFLLPEMITEREKRQQAAFIIFPNKVINGDTITNEVMAFENFSSLEIEIAAKSKRKILKQLELLGISEQFLFPEIDKKCIAIRDQTKFLIDQDE